MGLKRFSIGYAISGSISERRDKELKPEISIIILSLYRGEMTRNCIDSIQNCFGPPMEIIILDNGSTEKDLEILKEIYKKYDNVTLIFSPYNTRTSGGRNVASEVAEGEYLIFLDNDCIVSKNFVSSLLNSIKSNRKFGMVFAKIWTEEDYILTRGRQIIRHDGKSRIDFSDDRMPVSQSKTFQSCECDIAPGGASICRTDLFKEIRLNPCLFNHEDWDFCMELRKRDYKIIFCPNALMFHFPSKGDRSEYVKIRRDRWRFKEDLANFEKKWGISL